MSIHMCPSAACAASMHGTLTTTTTTNTFAWNGPVCPTCGANYLGAHRCSREDLARRIAELARLIDAANPPTPNPMAGCPCRKENGGSGVCGCIMGGAQITCSMA